MSDLIVRVLVFNGNHDAAVLCVQELKASLLDIDAQIVLDREEYLIAVAAGGWDLVVADLALPGYGGYGALADLRRRSSDTPFVLILGVGETEDPVTFFQAGGQIILRRNQMGRLISIANREAERLGCLRELRAKLKSASGTRDASDLNNGLNGFSESAKLIDSYLNGARPSPDGDTDN